MESLSRNRLSERQRELYSRGQQEVQSKVCEDEAVRGNNHA
jgi:hypothetical protein